jgi:hypothetical protein
MPTILRVGPYRIFFLWLPGGYASRDLYPAFWIEPVRAQRSGGFRRPEIIRIAKIIEENRTEIVEAGHEFFGS